MLTLYKYLIMINDNILFSEFNIVMHQTAGKTSLNLKTIMRFINSLMLVSILF